MIVKRVQSSSINAFSLMGSLVVTLLETTAVGATRRPWHRKIAYAQNGAEGVIRTEVGLDTWHTLSSRQLSSSHGRTLRRRHHTSCIGLRLGRRKEPQSTADVAAHATNPAMAMVNFGRIQYGERRTTGAVGTPLSRPRARPQPRQIRHRQWRRTFRRPECDPVRGVHSLPYLG